MATNNQTGRSIAILAMIFLYGMISFVTNLAAPIGVIWKNLLGDSNSLGMMGNMMNFLAYLFMGIPSGKLLIKVGYKKTALIAIAFGFLGVFTQFLSGQVLTDSILFGFPANWFVYLLGAFISGICVCMLNTVVNPMLNLLGGGGNKGNQLNMIGGTFNSLLGALTPMLVGAMIGQVTAGTNITNINVVLFLAMGVFVVAFLVLSATPIADPEQHSDNVVYEHSPWAFRHFVFGVIAVFVYVGVEIGIPGTLNFYLADTKASGAGLDPSEATSIAGSAVGTYWFLMLVGRTIGGFLAGKISSRAMMLITAGVASILIIVAMLIPKTITSPLIVFTGKDFDIVQLPLQAVLLVLCGLCTSVMWPSIFNLSTEGLGKYTAAASGIFMMMVVGGGVLPYVQNDVADSMGYMVSYLIPLLALIYMFLYALVLSKNVNTDIPVE